MAESESGFRRAVQEACARWGGATEPIIPVEPDGTVAPLWLQLLGIANVDELVNIDVDPAFVFRVRDAVDLRVVDLREIDRGGLGSYTCHPSAVSPARLPTSGWFDPSIVPGFMWVGAHESLDLWAAAAGGSISDAIAEREYANAQAIRITRDPMEVAWAQNSRATLLDRSIQQFAEHLSRSGPQPWPTVVWVCGQDAQLDESLHYWNRRALRPFALFRDNPMVLLPEWGISNWSGFSLRTLYEGRPDNFSPDAFFVSMNVPEERLKEIAESWSMVESTEDPRSTMSSPPPPARVEPFTYLADRDPTIAYLFARRYGLTSRAAVQIFRDRTPTQFDSPVSFSSSGRCIVSISASILDTFPHRAEIASLIAPTASWCEDGVQFATVAANMQYEFELRIPTLQEVTQTLLNRATDRWEVSDKGKVGQGVLGLPGSGALSEPGVYQAAKQLVTKRASYLEKVMASLEQRDPGFDRSRFLAEAGVGRSERTILSAQRISQLSGQDERVVLGAVEHMVALGWAERGLRVQCNRCSLSTFVPFAAVSTGATCPGCQAQQRYDVSGANLTVYYRLNSLIDRAVDQGVLPHLLTREALLRDGSEGYLYPGVQVTIEDVAAEADLFGVVNSKVVSGEVKSSAADFTIEQIEKDVWLATKLQADQYVMSSMEHLGPEQIEIAQSLVDEVGIELQVIGPRHLLPPSDDE